MSKNITPAKLLLLAQRGMIIALGLFFLAAGLVRCLLNTFAGNKGFAGRFDQDFAPGAATNALEYMAANSTSTVAEWFIAFLLCAILLQLHRMSDPSAPPDAGLSDAGDSRTRATAAKAKVRSP